MFASEVPQNIMERSVGDFEHSHRLEHLQEHINRRAAHWPKSRGAECEFARSPSCWRTPQPRAVHNLDEVQAVFVSAARDARDDRSDRVDRPVLRQRSLMQTTRSPTLSMFSSSRCASLWPCHSENQLESKSNKDGRGHNDFLKDYDEG
jgi:hypothetical protein